MNNEYHFFVGNEKKQSDNKIAITCPYDKSIVGNVHIANQNNIENAIAKAEQIFPITKKMSAYERADILENIINEIKKNIQQLSEILALECGKNIKFANAEVNRAIETFTLAKEECKRIEGDFFGLDSVKKGVGKSAIVKRFPIGPVLGITPFNYPLNLVAHKVAPALAVGNPIVIKPSSLAPISALLLGEIVTKYVPDGMLSILPCAGKDIEKFVSDERIKMLTFTGSADIGWKLKKLANKKKVCLELGGNAGLIIDKTADINDVVGKSIVGAFAYAGQVCIHTQRIFIHADIYDEFENKFIEKAKKIKTGHPLDKKVFLNSMITEKESIRAEEWTKEAINSGAKILCGGKRDGNNFEATILTDTTQNMRVESNEVFAPIVTLTKFDDLKDAVKMANNTKYGLQTGLFSNDMKNIFYAFENLEVGGVIINNTPTFRVDQMPYGGIKGSGFGREGV
ncbi:MAG: aldehyde dehydrogenase family protein, partial [Candidatus Marinimicrobia bacterium]|nr:aldehyde dehydrogenase family protein [Candidatus Neomarinimicrobiota bacterium]